VTGATLIERRDAAQATLDRFRVRPFAFGSADCVQMLAFHLRQLGYTVLLSKGGQYRTALGAKRSLKRAGFDSVAAALDGQGLEAITPAAALVGDIVQGPGDDGFGAFGIYLGNGRIVGFHQAIAGADVLQPIHLDRAWRV
jgi:hypothetical protein